MPRELTGRQRISRRTVRGANVAVRESGLSRRCRLAPGCPIDHPVRDTDRLLSHLPAPDEMNTPPSTPPPRLHSPAGTPSFSP